MFERAPEVTSSIPAPLKEELLLSAFIDAVAGTAQTGLLHSLPTMVLFRSASDGSGRFGW